MKIVKTISFFCFFAFLAVACNNKMEDEFTSVTREELLTLFNFDTQKDVYENIQSLNSFNKNKQYRVNGKSIKMVPIMRRTSSIVEMICFVFTICYSSIICETLTHSFLNQRYSKYNDKHHNSRCSCVVNLIAHIEHRVDVKGDCHCTIGRTCASIEQGEDFIIHL